MSYKDSLEWLKSLKQQIGQAQHRDLWHFEQAIDETIANLKPLAKPHGRLIDADRLIEILQDTLNGYLDKNNDSNNVEKLLVETCKKFVEHCPTVVEAEVSE